MNISGLDSAKFILCNASVGLCMDVLLVVAGLEGRKDQVPIVHHLQQSYTLEQIQIRYDALASPACAGYLHWFLSSPLTLNIELCGELSEETTL